MNDFYDTRTASQHRRARFMSYAFRGVLYCVLGLLAYSAFVVML